ncbi:MAG: hypothetical protein M3R45_05750 [Pseudomonadota bacterium]|nr:hypothetical protein [Pseudomonadota bacterium]
MKHYTVQRIAAGMALAGMGVLAGCASGGRAPTQAAQADPGALLYRCENGAEFAARFTDDTAVLKALKGARAQDVLLRDAGGQGAQQSVFSSPRLRAEFGLGAGAREAVLHYLQPPQVLRCVRD